MRSRPRAARIAVLPALIAAVSLAARPALAQEKAAVPPAKALYERLGGVYAIATVVDDFIERLLVDDTLNANPAIKEARDRVPKAGLKFHVTALVCEVTGGPCRYTGRTMKAAHLLPATGAGAEGSQPHPMIGQAATSPRDALPDLPRSQVPIASNLIIDPAGRIRFYSLLDTFAGDLRGPPRPVSVQPSGSMARHRSEGAQVSFLMFGRARASARAACPRASLCVLPAFVVDYPSGCRLRCSRSETSTFVSSWTAPRP